MKASASEKFTVLFSASEYWQQEKSDQSEKVAQEQQH